MFHTALVLAHCGANWKYCDGGTAATAILLLAGVIWAGKRAERKKQARREQQLQVLEAAGVIQKLAAEQRLREAGGSPRPNAPPPRPAGAPPQSRGTRKKQKPD